MFHVLGYGALIERNFHDLCHLRAIGVSSAIQEIYVLLIFMICSASICEWMFDAFRHGLRRGLFWHQCSLLPLFVYELLMLSLMYLDLTTNLAVVPKPSRLASLKIYTVLWDGTCFVLHPFATFFPFSSILIALGAGSTRWQQIMPFDNRTSKEFGRTA